MKSISVNLENYSYPIFIGKGSFNRLIGLIESSKVNRNLFIVIDKNVEKNFGSQIKNYFDCYEGKKYYYSFDALEKSKSFAALHQIYLTLIEQKFGRDTLLISIGGGVTGDLAGFAAATFMRGIQVVHIPTTLISMVDSSIGGKTGVNFNYYKNIVGAFHNPQFVLCDINFLNSLPKNEMIAGLGEIIKYAFTTNHEFFQLVEDKMNLILSLDEKILEKVITDSIYYKASVVSHDEKELGLRKVLNFGHTFGHAFERELKNKIKHGEAVTAGIICALYLSFKKKLISKHALERFLKLPLKVNLNIKLKTIDPERIYEHMFADKKNRNSQINFVLIRDIGEMILDINASKQEVIYAINRTVDSLP